MKKEMVADVKGRPLTTPPTRDPKWRETIITIHKSKGMAASLMMTKDIVFERGAMTQIMLQLRSPCLDYESDQALMNVEIGSHVFLLFVSKSK